MLNWLRDMGMNAKVAWLGVSSAVITAIALLTLAVWQSNQYNLLSQSEVDGLVDADLDHITQGIYHLVKTENEAVQQQVDGNLNVARHVLASAGDPVLSEETANWTAANQFTGKSITIQLPKMLVSGQWLGQNADPAIETPVVDEVTRLVGETATIFQQMNESSDMLRVATTVKDAAGRRAIGTYIPAINPDGNPNPVIASILNGETYHGRAFVVDAWYLTAYEPITNKGGGLVGMLYVGVKQASVESRVRQAILQTKVGKTGYVYVLSGKGEDRGRYIISQKGERDGENIWENKDNDGQLVIQAIIQKAMVLKPGELATVRYPWKNPDDPAPRWKIARLAYFAPWDWVIGTSVYEDELQSYRAFLTNGRIQMIRTMGLAGLVITLLIGLAGILVAWTITRPVQQMTKAVETIIEGNLDQTLNIRSHDEIGALAQSFNVMTKKLSSTMEGLRRSEEKYRFIFENAIEGLFQTSIEGRFLSASPAMARILGYDSPEELMAVVTDLKQQVYAHPADRDAVISAVLESKGAIEKELQLYRKDRQTIWVLLSICAVRDNTGKIPFLQGFLTDITERKRFEEELQKLNKLQSAILDNSPVGIAFVRNRTIEWVNRRVLEMFGISIEQCQGLSARILYPDDKTYERLGAEIYPLLAQGKKATFEVETHRGDGSSFWCRMDGKALDASHLDQGVIWIVEDITERKQERESLLRTQFAMDRARDSILWVDDKGCIVYANDSACTSMGYTRDELMAMTVFDIDPDFPPNQWEQHKRDMRRHGTMLFEGRHVAKNGRIFPVEVSSSHFEFDGRWFACASDRDITERKRSEEALQKLNRLQSVILDNSTVGIAFVRDRVFEWVNPRMPELFGIPMEQFKGASTRIIYPSDEDYQRLGTEAYPLLAQGKRAAVELEMRKGDGSSFWCRLEGNALNPARPQEGSIWIWEDITERKRTEAALAKRIVALTQPLDTSEGISFDDLFNVKDIQRIQDEIAAATGVASIITRPDGTPITTPSKFCRLCNDIIRKTEKGRFNCYRSDANLGRYSKEGPIVQPCLSGGLWDAGASINVGGRHLANWLIGQVRDNTQTEEKMREYAREIGVGEDVFLEAFREVPSMSRAQFDQIAQLLFTVANQLSAMAYQNVQQSRFIADRQRAEEDLRKHRDRLEELVQERTGELLAKNTQLVGEISERKQAEHQRALMELQLRQAQKLESIGQLAAGIAHEINTPIQYVGDNLRFLKEAFSDLNKMSAMYQKVVEAAPVNAVTPELLHAVRETAQATDLEYLTEEVPKAVQQALEGVDRVAKIVRAMKEFSHPGAKEKTLVDLNHAVETTVTVARNEWKYVAEAVLDLDPTLPPVPCLPGEFNQVILNLIINAAHAIADLVGDGDGDKGTITITTRRQSEGVEIRIQDTGTGIPEEARDRVFDPFFTTKPVGKGTGQGLAIARSVVVDKHGGSIAFETELGKGTTFIVWLPLSASSSGSGKTPG